MVIRLQIAGIAAALVFPAQSAQALTATCVLEVAGKPYIDGPCDFNTGSWNNGSFKIHGANGKYFAYVYVDGKRATAYWNGRAAERRAHDPLGELRRDGECWVSDAARICVSPMSAEAAAVAPFGTWDCGAVMRFTLDAKNYTVNGKSGGVKSIERFGNDGYGVTLSDDYRFALFDVKAKTLTWHSPESGDTFECRKAK